MKEKRRIEDTWPEETAWDHLNNAFKALRRKGILALHDAGFTQSDGLSLVADAIDEQAPDKSLLGYCFYHRQDIQHAIESRQLLLSHGTVDGAPETTGKVVTLILEALERAGLTARWNGDESRKIEVNDFTWQKRSPRSTRGKSSKAPE